MTGEGAPDPANPHPDKRVPAIVHDRTLVAESVAIVLYLGDAFPEAGVTFKRHEAEQPREDDEAEQAD